MSIDDNEANKIYPDIKPMALSQELNLQNYWPEKISEFKTFF